MRVDCEAVAIVGGLGLWCRSDGITPLDLRKNACGIGGSGEVPRPGERRRAGKQGELMPGEAQKEREISSRPLAWLGQQELGAFGRLFIHGITLGSGMLETETPEMGRGEFIASRLPRLPIYTGKSALRQL